MISCRQAHSAILAAVRRQLSEAAQLRLEEHLERCASCREERARMGLLEQLRDQPVRHLGADARARVLERLTGLSAEEPAILTPLRRRRWPLLAAVAAAAVVLAVVGLSLRGSRQARPQAPTATAPAPERAAVISAVHAGKTMLPGAQVLYRAGSTLRVHAARRQVDLFEGEVEVEATRGRGPFRVVTPRFIVEVLGTRFVVRLDSVRTLRGRVRVLDRAGHELALVSAGDAWRAPELQAALPAASQPASQPTCAPTAAVAPPPAPVRRAPTAAQLLDQARTLLAEGDTARARTRISAALALTPSARQRATAERLGADALLVERQHDLALAAYQRVSERFPGSPEAETAAFAAAQILCERGRVAPARAALEGYLARYPAGRFVREAREKLATLSE